MRLLIVLFCLLTLSCGTPSPVENIAQVTDDHFSYSNLKVEKGSKHRATDSFGDRIPGYDISYEVTGQIHNRSGINLSARFDITVETSEGTIETTTSQDFIVDEKRDFVEYSSAHSDDGLIEFKDVTLEYIPVGEDYRSLSRY